ncbi:hypothetical protein [Candidatus Phycosocius spiralis]|uniref:Uncharacterized protein n=1 Tax=Candidatus Phycosocius spiralis TaxID=2815099 RepID=A0ABQ4PY34_9PROT|nr:hypothetical protein [Candidatus Phycosocius spiralis]GIU67851.1 hypothetical protein PsB1_2005 [Candidatus Phycosocius spiralis]
MAPYARQVIRRSEADGNYNTGDPVTRWYRFGGRQMGMVTNNSSAQGGTYADSIAQRQNPPASGTPGPFANGAASGKQDEQVSSNLAMINSK